MSTEFIKIERTITKSIYGLEWEDKLIQLSSNGGYDLSPEFKDQLWDDMAIDSDELSREFGELYYEPIDWDRDNEICAKRSLYRELHKKSLDKMTEYDKELFAILSKDTDLKLLVDQYSMASLFNKKNNNLKD